MNTEKLNLYVRDNRIENAAEIILNIHNLEYNFNTLEYLKNLLNNLKFHSYSNSIMVIRELEVKISQFEERKAALEEQVHKENGDINIEELQELIIRKNVYGETLNKEEQQQINIGIDTLMYRLTNNILKDDLEKAIEEKILEDYMEPIFNTYQEVLHGNIELSLSEEEELLAQSYKNYKSVYSKTENNDIPKLKKENNGLASIVIILEMVSIAGLLALILSIA